MSCTYTRNSSGPKTLPCGTPVVNLTSLDSCPPIFTLRVRPTRNSLTQTTTLESTPEAASIVSSRSGGTKSKALEKSIIIASIPVPSSIESALSWYTVMTGLSHEYPGLNLCCILYVCIFYMLLLILWIMHFYFYVHVFLLLCKFCSGYSVPLPCSVYFLCVNVYCTTATGCQPNCS